MPELPEVQTVVDTLAPLAVGRQILRGLHVRNDMLKPGGIDLFSLLKDRSVASIHRRAKRIVFTLDDRARFYIHLGMTGQLTLDPYDAPIKTHTHLILQLEGGRQIRFVDPRRFGAIVWMGLDEHTHVGPEPLALRPDRLGRLLAKTSRAIKTALLDQTLIAGIGNIYADEALFIAGVRPTTRACELKPDDILRLNRAIKLVLRRAIRAGGSSIRDYVDANGARGSFQERHRVYGREGKPCANCKTPIQRIVLGGRSTHFCPTCQAG